jgi:hypothetical protein
MQEQDDKKPLISFFLQPYPVSLNRYIEDEPCEYSEALAINLSIEGIPISLSRMQSYPTNCTTPGHTIPSGYTRSGKWKPSKFVAGKTDKRAGK